MNNIQVRAARVTDEEIIAEFNICLARETEQKELPSATVLAGVRAALADTALGRYFVATVDDQIIGQLLITYEWSDWRNGQLWWVQSVYVAEPFRRKGVFRQLLQAVEDAAKAATGVVGLRLYVEHNNLRAQQTYSASGWIKPGYEVMERLFDAT